MILIKDLVDKFNLWKIVNDILRRKTIRSVFIYILVFSLILKLKFVLYGLHISTYF